MIFTFFTKHGTLIRRSTVLSLPLPLVFLALKNTLAYSPVVLITTLKIFNGNVPGKFNCWEGEVFERGAMLFGQRYISSDKFNHNSWKGSDTGTVSTN
jgi:hypothetical protein